MDSTSPPSDSDRIGKYLILQDLCERRKLSFTFDHHSGVFSIGRRVAGSYLISTKSISEAKIATESYLRGLSDAQNPTP